MTEVNDAAENTAKLEENKEQLENLKREAAEAPTEATTATADDGPSEAVEGFNWEAAENHLREERQVRCTHWGPGERVRRMVQNAKLSTGTMQLQKHDGDGQWDYYVPDEEDIQGCWVLV